MISAARSTSVPLDMAFRIVPRGFTCFLTFRIENSQAVPVQQDQYGCFFDGDTYIVLAAFQPGEETGAITNIKEVKGSLDTRIHIWIGENATQESSAVVKAAELEDYLTYSPVLFREVQGHESATFLNYFKRIGGIKYSPGGFANGFLHLDQTVKPRLMCVKGKHYARIQEVSISWSSMKNTDVYVLDVGDALFVWTGKFCCLAEKIKAMDYARKLRDDRGRGNIIVLEDGEESPEQIGEDCFELFDEYLPLSEKPQLQINGITSNVENGYVTKNINRLRLWRYSEDGSQLKLTDVTEAPFNKNMLNSKECFMVVNGVDGIWIWCGKGSRDQEKREALTNALAFANQQKYPKFVQITRVQEGGEPSAFKLLFAIWEKEKVPVQLKTMSSRVSTTVQTKFDAATMHANPQLAMETGMVDDGSGTKKIWRVECKEDACSLVELEKKYLGQLYGGDCYVILYTYLYNRQERYIIYYWLGKRSTDEEMRAVVDGAVELDKSLNGLITLVRVCQGREPSHFLAMFGSKLVVFSGGKTGVNYQQQDEGPGDAYLLRVGGAASYASKAEQVPCSASSLNSNDVLVLFSKSGVYVWAGKGCTGDEREMGKQIANLSPKGYHMLTEGQEREEFWNELGGRGDYAKTLQSHVELEDKQSRLLHCSSVAGLFKTKLLVDYSQQDLLAEDLFILDAYDRVYVWLGQDANVEDKSSAMEATLEYITSDPSGRDMSSSVFLVRQGCEPPDFIGYFPSWNREFWDNKKTFEQMKAELGERNVSLQRDKTTSNGDLSFSELAKHSYEVLVKKENLPEGLDLQHKEKHLSSEEFQEHFQMTYAEFVILPIWKQQHLKKQTLLW